MNTVLGRVSVIIPSYNHAPYIRQCVDSALAQTYPNVEVVVVDDGSTDGSIDILRSYGDKIVLIEQENGGTQAARNTAIRASSGEYVALLDSDDLWLPHKLERQMQVFRVYTGTALVYSYATRVDAQCKVLGDGATFGLDAPDPARVYETLLEGCHIPALTAVFRRSCLAEVGFFDETLLGSGDWDMWLKIAERWPVRCVPEPLALYRVHASNTTKMLFATSQVIAEHKRVLDRYLSTPGRRAVPQDVANRARARVEVMAAECAMLQRAPEDVGAHLAAALKICPDLDTPEWLAAQVMNLAQGDEGQSWRQRRDFAEAVFHSIRAHGLRPVRAWRSVRSELALAQAFEVYHEGRRFGLAEPLFAALASRPAYLRNGGVLSMLTTLLVGPRAKSALARIARSVACLA